MHQSLSALKHNAYHVIQVDSLGGTLHTVWQLYSVAHVHLILYQARPKVKQVQILLLQELYQT